MATIRLKRRPFHEACSRAELYTSSAQGKAFGVSHSAVWRVMDLQSEPGPKLIAGVLRAFPDLSFEDLFELVDDEPATEPGNGDEDAA